MKSNGKDWNPRLEKLQLIKEWQCINIRPIDLPPVFLFLVLFLTLTFFPVASSAEIDIRDDTNQLISLGQPARRIISLAPNITELLFAAGAGDAVVGVVDFSDYPPAAKQIQNIGDHQNYDLELILSLRPDLVVAWGSGSSNEKIRKLKSLGLTVFVIEPRRFEGIANNIEKLGRLAGTDKTARDASDHFRDTYKQLKEKYADKKKLQVFFQIWNQPLMTINGQHLISDVIRLCGGTNVFSGLLSLAPGIDIEAVLASNPDVIVVSGDEESRSKWIDDWYKWSNLKAVKNDHLFLVPADLINRQTPRILLGAQQMCEQFESVRRK